MSEGSVQEGYIKFKFACLPARQTRPAIATDLCLYPLSCYHFRTLTTLNSKEYSVIKFTLYSLLILLWISATLRPFNCKKWICNTHLAEASITLAMSLWLYCGYDLGLGVDNDWDCIGGTTHHATRRSDTRFFRIFLKTRSKTVKNVLINMCSFVLLNIWINNINMLLPVNKHLHEITISLMNMINYLKNEAK